MVLKCKTNLVKEEPINKKSYTSVKMRLKYLLLLLFTIFFSPYFIEIEIYLVKNC